MITDRDEEFRATVLALYLQELGRPPEAVGPIELEGWVQHAREGMTGEQLRQLFHDSPEGIAYREKPPEPVKPPRPTTPRLHVEGRDFVDDEGARVSLCGADQFCAFRQFLDGADLAPLFKESQELGFNLWRVFLMGSRAQNSILELRPTETPGFYEQLRPFADLLNAQGVMLLATVFVDAQDAMSNAADRHLHWQAVAEKLRGSATLLSGGNEFSKNGFDPGELSDPVMPWSRGSNTGDAAPFSPPGTFAEFHPVRHMPTMLFDSVASPVYLYSHGVSVPLIIDEPIGFAENDQPGRRSNDPQLAYRLARHYSTECAGAVFHNDSGMRGQVMTPTIRACAAAWQRGMKL